MNINVTKPFLPPIEEYRQYIENIWKRNWLTNHGPLVNELELKLQEYLDVKHLLFLSNGTTALQIAIKALNKTGEIITTPFSYVATTSAIVWEGCTPVFADIDENSFNIDPSKIENLITDKTISILATHVYGNPCDVEAIKKIADKYNLKVIYDAAHAFGTKYKGNSIFSFGDISIASFHATKLFHTIEGGAVITNDSGLQKKMSYLRNFGHETAETFADIGINGKNSEFHAAMGLCNLRYINTILRKRKEISRYYDEILRGLKVKKPFISNEVTYNYSYYPILFESEEILDASVSLLNLHGIFPRKYFKPSLCELPYVKGEACRIAHDYSRKILCLPLYHDLIKEEQNLIASILLKVQNSN